MDEKKINGKTLRLLKGDVTDQEVDAFVYYARSDLVIGSGFGTAIAVRGGPSIQEELKSFDTLKVGEAIVTAAGEMKAKHIIHAVGPKFQEENEERKLRDTMVATLKKADEKGISSLALPPMGTGFYGIPLDVSARVMVDTIQEHLKGQTPLAEVTICLGDNREYIPFQQRFQTIAAS